MLKLGQLGGLRLIVVGGWVSLMAVTSALAQHYRAKTKPTQVKHFIGQDSMGYSSSIASKLDKLG